MKNRNRTRTLDLKVRAAACAELQEARNATVSFVLGTGTEAATGVLKGTRRRTSLPEPPWLMH